jgi:recombination protein RecR
LLKRPKEQTIVLANALIKFTQDINLCPNCFNFMNNSGQNLCAICQDTRRDQTSICVVADYQDLIAIETTHYYNGSYHILGGNLNPLKSIGPESLRIKELIERIKQNKIKEIILAFDPNAEGEMTTLYLRRELNNHRSIKITRLGRGLPQGGDLDYADEITLEEALKGRREV